MKNRAVVLIAMLALSGGCLTAEDARQAEKTEEEAGETFTEAEADTVLEYNLVDFAFQGPTTAEGPNVLFRAQNTGTQDHQLEVLDAGGDAVDEIEAFSPGEEAEPLTAVLEPGIHPSVHSRDSRWTGA